MLDLFFFSGINGRGCSASGELPRQSPRGQKRQSLPTGSGLRGQRERAEVFSGGGSMADGGKHRVWRAAAVQRLGLGSKWSKSAAPNRSESLWNYSSTLVARIHLEIYYFHVGWEIKLFSPELYNEMITVMNKVRWWFFSGLNFINGATDWCFELKLIFL